MSAVMALYPGGGSSMNQYNLIGIHTHFEANVIHASLSSVISIHLSLRQSVSPNS